MGAAPKILLTGRPGIGKTTIIVALAKKLGNRAGGFFTREIREGGERIGFAIETIDGKRGTLARVNLPRGPKIGRYTVLLHDLEALAIPALRLAAVNGKIVLLDEIGRMELCSSAFVSTVTELLAGPAAMVATIALHGDARIEKYKSFPGVRIITVTEKNRDQLPDNLMEQLI
ncbi:MAG: NTPase [candidate division KSB1 bacterium]|nr:NTPase [candidate division KSB1 bacterium]MDZ7304968.1 NTPase [candidate division KSB1 bacterium]MDZ7313999.1 NTPase [candidate division KSB1 bacterium]